MRKVTSAILLFLIFGSLSFGQYTAALSNRTVSPNDTVKINLSVTGLSGGINSFQFSIQFDPAILTYQGISNAPAGIMPPSVSGGNTIILIWTSVTTTPFPNGTLLTLIFKYHGLACPVPFIPLNCEVAKFVGGNIIVLTGSFSDGSVGPFMGNTAKAKLDSIQNAPLGTVVVPLKYSGFPGTVGAITQRISYDPSKLTFIGVSGTGNLSTGFNANLSSGIVTITWTSVAGKDINFPGSMFNINFSYINASATNVNFSTGCIIETTTPVTNIPVTYFNGYVAPPPVLTSFATLDSIPGVIQGQIIDVPLNFESMPSNTTNFNLNIFYSYPQLQLVGIFYTAQPVNYNVNGNMISISYSNATTPTPSINGQFLVLRFLYAGVGIASVNFGSGCQFSNGAPIGVGYTNGLVTPGVVTGNNANITYVTKSGSGPVAVPVTFSDMPTNLGAVTMLIGFDNTKLTYTGYTSPHTFSPPPKLNGNILSVSWDSNNIPTNLNGVFITLQFNYVSGSGTNCGAAVYFTDVCEISDPVGALVPSNWNNGGVNVKFKISGILQYDNAPLSSPLVGFTVKLKSGVLDIASSSTSATGYFEMWVVNGSYTLDAVPSATAGYFSDENDAQQIIFYAGGWGWPDINALRLSAGDVNQDGITDENDAQLINFRAGGWPYLPDWSLPDWIFGDINTVVKSVSVGCEDVSNITFYGLCSGNVTGSYIP